MAYRYFAYLYNSWFWQINFAQSFIQSSFKAPAQKLICRQDMWYISLDKTTVVHMSSNIHSGIEFYFLDPNNSLIVDLIEKLNNLSAFSCNHSIIDLFKNRIVVWKNYCKSTIITKNLVHSLLKDLYHYPDIWSFIWMQRLLLVWRSSIRW